MVHQSFEYVKENLNRVIKDPDNVLYLKPANVGNKQALFAMIREEKGVYRNIQITKEQSKWIFPWEPIYYFYKDVGHLFMKEYIPFYNWQAYNVSNLDGFKFKKLDDFKILNVGIFATFSDGSAAFVLRKKEKEFQHYNGIQFYLNLLEQYKDYNPHYDTYKIIECYGNGDNTYVIPELQENGKEHPKVKTLTNYFKSV